VFPQNAWAIRFYEAAGFALDTIPPKSFQLAGLQLQEVRYVRHLDALMVREMKFSSASESCLSGSDSGGL
jgi:hypothetical protein